VGKKEKYVTVNLDDLSETDAAIVNAVIHEGELRERDRIMALWDAEMECTCEEPMQHLAFLIKGEEE
jgi:hypothetical protein